MYAERILWIDLRHELFSSIEIRCLVNEAQPVIDNRLRGVAPGIVQVLVELTLVEFRQRSAVT
jgi:hypothetical protein